MRFWPFRGRPVPPSADSSAFAIGELAPQLSGVLAVAQVRAEGHAVAFGGRLLQSPDAAITSLQPRFRSFGYTPFLQASDGLTWVRALPFVEVEVPSRPRVNIILFFLTVLSTFMAGALPLGAIPCIYWAYNPVRLNTTSSSPVPITRDMFPKGDAGQVTFQNAVNAFSPTYQLREPRKTFRFTVATTF